MTAMPTRQFDTTAVPKTRPTSAGHTSVFETVTPEPASRARLPHVDPGFGALPARLQAADLSRASGGHLARVGQVLLQLQRRHGNRYVQEVLGHPRRVSHPAVPLVRAELTVGPADDRHERAADRVAEQMMRGTAQRAPGAGVNVDRPLAVQGLPVQGLPNAAEGAVDAPVAQAIQQARVGGRAVPGAFRERMEQTLGADLSGVRIHTDARSGRLNDALQSRAFTVGADVFVGRGQYRPGTPAGDGLLAHELTHTVQQGAARVRGQAAGAARQAPAAGHRTVHRTVSGPMVVQRKLIRLGGTKPKPTRDELEWTDVEFEPAVRDAEKVVRRVIRMVAGNSKIHLTFTDAADLVAKATTLAGTPSPQLINSASQFTLGLLLVHWRENGKDYEQFRSQINSSRATYERQRIRRTGGPRFHTPRHDQYFSLTKGWAKKPADRTGRKDAKWRSTKNRSRLIPAATTGSVNLELLTQEEKSGSVLQVGNFYVQLCPGCGGAEDVQNFEVDHQQAFSTIREQFLDLADLLNSDKKAERGVRNTLGPKFDTYFTTEKTVNKKNPTKIVASKAAMNTFSNDLDNLMRICRKCNGATGKSDKNYLDWYLGSDLFGPQFVKKNLIDDRGYLLPRAKGDQGWGAAARKWFQDNHLAVLKKLIHARRLQEATRASLVQESSSRISATNERNPSRKRKLEVETEQLSFRNARTVGVTKVLTRSHTSADLPRIRSGSPERDVVEVKKLMQGQEESRKRRRLAETDPYAEGHDVGYGTKATLSKKYKGEDLAAYQHGHAAGIVAAQVDKDHGYTDAVTTGKRTRKYAGGAPYDRGFKIGMDRIAEFRMQGEKDGSAGAPPNAAIVKPNDVNAGYFFQAYLKGYNDGLATL